MCGTSPIVPEGVMITSLCFDDIVSLQLLQNLEQYRMTHDRNSLTDLPDHMNWIFDYLVNSRSCPSDNIDGIANSVVDGRRSSVTKLPEELLEIEIEGCGDGTSKIDRCWIANDHVDVGYSPSDLMQRRGPGDNSCREEQRKHRGSGVHDGGNSLRSR